jgi:IcmF-related N-terminal domain
MSPMSELVYLFSSFVNLPTWLRNGIYILSALSIIGVGLAFSPIVALIVAIGLLLVVITLGIYAFIIKQRRERQQAALTGGLEQNTLATPQGISDAGRRARLDALRKRFQEGIDKFRSVGKDLYRLPWYVVIGEPAAGKSEAIRRSEIGFPPGMQDEFQGVGGTINMNWWFTNSAIILDTAGRLLFEEVIPGTTSEWKEFLALLRKHRPLCPVNGLLLVIPAESLIKDPPKRIQERAGWIARQLDNIQRELDIRFPVYVVISKCDLLNGFREFFEDVDDPHVQRQMLGWSNPDPLDAPFRPELIEQHLASVVERLRRRRLGLLEDPVAKDSNNRRVEEVDRLYAFPNSLSMISANLRQYLSTIFVAGEWSAKPLFLRGIYFTSSLREGAELDQELALAMGVSVEELPTGRAWEREISFFLRDLFVEKIFREWGLVTRATDTKKLLRRRALAVFGAGLLAMAVLLLFSWLGYSRMKDSIGRQSGYWLRAGEGWSDDHEWMPIVTKSDPGYTYNGDQPVGRGERSQTKNLFDGGGKSLVNFHGTLRDLTERPLQISALFRPFYRIVGNFDAQRKQAQRIVFEGSVVKPLLEATRQKITAPVTAAPAANLQLEADALLSLIQIESGLVKRQQFLDSTIATPDQVIPPLQKYVVDRDFDPTLVDVGDWTYTKGDGAKKWPGRWMSGGSTLVRDKEGYNKSLDLGIEHFRQSIQRSLAETETNWKLIRELVEFLKGQFEPKEQDLIQAANTPGRLQQLDPLLETPHKEFEKMAALLNEKLQSAKKAGLFKDGPVSLVAAYELIMKERKQKSTTLKVMIDNMLAATVLPETKITRPSPLLKEIQDRLTGLSKESQSELQGIDVAELKRLDETYIEDYARKGPVFAVRADLYSRSLKTTRQKAEFDSLIGTDWAALKKLIEDVSRARKEVLEYQGKQKKEAATVCAYWLDYAETHQIDECCAAYLRQAREAVLPFIHFPLVWPPEEAALTGDQVRAAAKLVATIHRDLHSETFGKIRPESRGPLEAFDKRLALLDPVLRGLVAPGDRISTCRISMPAGPPPPPTVPPTPDPVTHLMPAPTPRIPVFMYELRAETPTARGHATGNLGKQGRVRVGDGRVLIDRLPLDTVFHFHSYLDDRKKEVECGNNWSALRLLTKSSAAAQDGINWEIKMDDPWGAAVLDVRMEQAIAPIATWPTRETLGLGQ